MAHVAVLMGKVHPEAGDWYFDEPLVVKSGDDEFQIAVVHSKFSIRVTSPSDEDVDGDWFRQLWSRASAALRGALDGLGFYRGARLEVEFVGATFDNNGVLFEQPNHLDFAYTQDSRIEGEQLAPLTWHAFDNAHIRHALADVRQALTLDGDAGFHCYRAIESLRQHYLLGDEDDGSARKLSWESLRDDLGVSRAEIDVIREAAKSRRHGGAQSVAYADILAHVKWTRDIVMRFIERLPTVGPGRLAELDV